MIYLRAIARHNWNQMAETIIAVSLEVGNSKLTSVCLASINRPISTSSFQPNKKLAPFCVRAFFNRKSIIIIIII